MSRDCVSFFLFKRTLTHGVFSLLELMLSKSKQKYREISSVALIGTKPRDSLGISRTGNFDKSQKPYDIYDCKTCPHDNDIKIRPKSIGNHFPLPAAPVVVKKKRQFLFFTEFTDYRMA